MKKMSTFFGAVLAMIASAAFVPAHAGGNNGYQGHPKGNPGSFTWNSNKNYNSSWSKSSSRSRSSASANNSIVFKNGTDWGNVAFGVAGIIGALNPPQPQRIIFRGGDVKVQVNFIAGGVPALPCLKGACDQSPGHTRKCPDGFSLDPVDGKCYSDD